MTTPNNTTGAGEAIRFVCAVPVVFLLWIIFTPILALSLAIRRWFPEATKPRPRPVKPYQHIAKPLWIPKHLRKQSPSVA